MMMMMMASALAADATEVEGAHRAIVTIRRDEQQQMDAREGTCTAVVVVVAVAVAWMMNGHWMRDASPCPCLYPCHPFGGHATNGTGNARRTNVGVYCLNVCLMNAALYHALCLCLCPGVDDCVCACCACCHWLRLAHPRPVLVHVLLADQHLTLRVPAPGKRRPRLHVDAHPHDSHHALVAPDMKAMDLMITQDRCPLTNQMHPTVQPSVQGRSAIGRGKYYRSTMLVFECKTGLIQHLNKNTRVQAEHSSDLTRYL